jgi:hypothetical protein
MWSHVVKKDNEITKRLFVGANSVSYVNGYIQLEKVIISTNYIDKHNFINVRLETYCKYLQSLFMLMIANM